MQSLSQPGPASNVPQCSTRGAEFEAPCVRTFIFLSVLVLFWFLGVFFECFLFFLFKIWIHIGSRSAVCLHRAFFGISKIAVAFWLVWLSPS